MLAAGDVATAAAWNVVVGDIVDHETRILALPRGYKGATTLATSFNTTSTSYVDVTGLSVTFTAEASRRYRVTLYPAMINAGANITQVIISDGTNDLVEGYAKDGTYLYTATIFAITTPSAGSVTYKARLKTNAGTASLYGTDARASLGSRMLVEDIGPA